MIRIPWSPGLLFPRTPRPLLTFWLQSLVFLTAASISAAGLEPVALRCEYRENPLGIDETKPRLSWRVESRERGQRQTAYQLLVATSQELLQPGKADLWDSGKVSSDETVNIEYAGKELSSGLECFWAVRTWDVEGEASGWSKPAMWAMGLLKPAEWRADISYRDDSAVHKDPNTLFLPAARQYRKEFSAERRVKRATIYATALGIYELHVNGKRVGDALFAPGWTVYRQRAYYHTYDVTRLLNRGPNAIGAWVADGWYSGYLGFALLTGVGVEKVGRYSYGKTPALMAQLQIEYEDGTREIIGTDRTWKVTSAGPIREADFLMGEYYDARNEMPGWTTAGFDDSGWEPAILAGENGPAKATFYEFANGQGDKGPEVVGREVDLGFKRPPVLQAFPGMPIRHIEEIKPVALTSRATASTFSISARTLPVSCGSRSKACRHRCPRATWRNAAS
jgi:alpha-L-rhamnosidase